MPVKKTKKGYSWGNQKPTTKKKAQARQRAAYANGYKKKK